MTDDLPLKPAPPPRQVDTARIVHVGIALFALAAVILVLLPWSRDDADNRVWLWTAAAGTVLGLAGLLVMRWQKAPTADQGRTPAHSKK